MKTKFGVSLFGLDIKMRPALIAIGRLWRLYGKEAVITETTGGKHSDGSLHPFGLAVDVRTRYFDQQTKEKVYNGLLKALHGQQFDVVLHNTHIHVEKDEEGLR